ncbi:hypothetical protein [Methanospirillum hungatei]|jgi:hypothetical protein|uniref:hypothetical protein n=1 Tax=Methanospirillum hungatei TaxID=2203 RepID=UPI002C2DBA38|nr:hypothetical protein [Methanospirillum hungatei]HOW04799.1 hypothetical protein [Methanospirillum hungatei]
MKKIIIGILTITLVSCTLLSAGCSSVIKSDDLSFLSSLKDFKNESMTQIQQINENVKLKQWDAVRTDLSAYQDVITREVDSLNKLEVSERLIPIRDKAVEALVKEEKILQSIQNLSELNASVISDIAGNYLSGVIENAIKSAISE